MEIFSKGCDYYRYTNPKAVSWEQYDEVCSELSDFLEETRRLREEIQYMTDYIHQKGMDAEFAWFQQDAHEEQGADLPFSRLVIDTLSCSTFVDKHTTNII